MQRRDFILGSLAGLAWPLAIRSSAPGDGARKAAQSLDEIEARAGGRLGVATLEVDTGRRLVHRPDERFPMCSTFKWLLVAQVLSRVDRGEERLERRVAYDAKDLLEHAPTTRARLGEGFMSVSELCEAAIEVSDNTAANLLLSSVGGPGGFTAYLRGLGDSVTRLDRIEPELNSAVAGDPRDTTTPAAMVANLRSLLLGSELSQASRKRLIGYLVGSTTGAAKLRAGLPGHWRVGDKTGTGANGATNDVAIVWPAPQKPFLVAAYLAEAAAPEKERNGALADVGHLVAGWVGA
ncbi:MAG TPA: class A beta-lactamase [Candidatus Polarisedimenticolia bacterium]|nr:class A beta-lactamase [Candidatus Polarisedimenticolia bacterium]